jgi:hypothetical protein
MLFGPYEISWCFRMSFQAFDPNEISLWDVVTLFSCMFLCRCRISLCDFLHLWALMRFPHEIVCVLQYNCRMQFPVEMFCFLLHSFLVRCPYLISRFFGRYKVSFWDLCFLTLMRCREIFLWDFMLLGRYAISLWFYWRFAGWFSDEISCCFSSYEIPFWDFMLLLHILF